MRGSATPLLVFVLAAACLASLAAAPAARADLFSYLAKPDNSYSWELRSVQEVPQGKIYDIHMVSQVWEGIKWEHQVQVYEPTKIVYPDVMGLLITGGTADASAKALGLLAANMSGMRIGVLYNIPNQPLFNGLSEDALISYTWVKYIDTGDENWVLLFPMVKAAVRCMDCLDSLAQQRWHQKLRGFMVTGASKRGWTTYLTGIADPKRVLAIAPMVFDILNMPVNIRHQVNFWGSYSPMIKDYTEKGLQTLVDTPRGFRLIWMVDPYSYRDRMLMPKLVILGSNDPYWPIDAVTYYWRGLSEPRYLMIDPNSGHGLDDKMRVLASLTGFLKLIASKEPLPTLQWQWTDKPDGSDLAATVTPAPAEARMWVARSPVRDFRKAEWVQEPVKVSGGKVTGEVAAAARQWTAAYGEMVLDLPVGRIYVSTEPRVIPPKFAQ